MRVNYRQAAHGEETIAAAFAMYHGGMVNSVFGGICVSDERLSRRRMFQILRPTASARPVSERVQ